MSLAIKASRARAGSLNANLGRSAVALARSNAPAFPAVSRAGFQGDPGLFGFLGKAISSVGSFLPGPLGGIAGAIGGALGGGGQGGPGGSLFAQQTVPFPPVFQETPGFIGQVQRALPFGKTGFEEVAVNGACANGHHLNKSDYFLKDGTFIQKGSRCVKDRRKNPLNPRALSSAIKRVESAKKKEQVLKRITIRCKPHGKASCPTCR